MHIEQCRWEGRFVLNLSLNVSVVFASCWFRTVCLAIRTCRLSESGHITAFKVLESIAREAGELAFHAHKILSSNNNKSPQMHQNQHKTLFPNPLSIGFSRWYLWNCLFPVELKSSQILVWRKRESLCYGLLLHAWAFLKIVPFESRTPVAVSSYESAVQGLWSPKHTSSAGNQGILLSDTPVWASCRC